MKRSLLIGLLLIGSTVFAASEIDVVVMYPSHNNLSSSQRFAQAVNWQNQANIALQMSGVNDRRFLIDPSIDVNATLNYSSSFGYGDILNWVRNQNSQPTSNLRLARDHQFGNNRGADLILVSENRPLGTACGAAPPPPAYISLAHRETNAFGVINTNGFCNTVQQITVPHELGHLLYAEHQTNSYDSSPNHTDLQDTNDQVPVKYNHGGMEQCERHQIEPHVLSCSRIDNATATTLEFVGTIRVSVSDSGSFVAVHRC